MYTTNYDWHDKLIGRYQLHYLLGAGGMGEVWLATDTQLRRQVAIKLLPVVLIQNRGSLSDFAHEAHASAGLEHPHILTIHDFGEHQTAQCEIIPYLVMPYVAGGTLRTHIETRKGKIPVIESLHYLRQAGLAIDFAHSRQVLHRDIKPGNMLLSKEWLLLSDFGIAKILNSISQHNKTYAGAGTPEYMAPEQIMGYAGPGSDLYSLAIIAYQLFTGHLPFHGATPADTLTMQLKATPNPPRQLNMSIPPQVEQVLLQCLAKQPEQRLSSCIQFVDALESGWANSSISEHDPDSTLLAPWSKRWQEQNQTLKPPPAGHYAVNTPPDSVIQLGFDQRPLPTISAFQPQMASFPSAMPAAKPIDIIQPQGPQPDQIGQRVEAKPGRRALLVSGLGLVAVLAVGGTTASILLNKHTPPALPAKVLGPKKLIPAVAVLKLTGHMNEVWGVQWEPSGHYLLTSAADTNLMLWDIAGLLKRSAVNNIIAAPTQKFSVAGINFNNTDSGICWSLDGKKLIVGNTTSQTLYVLNISKLDTPILYTQNPQSNANYFSVCAGPGNNFFTVANGAKSEAQVWRFGTTNKPQNSFLIDSKNPDSLANFLSQMQWSPDGKTLAALDAPIDGPSKLVLWPNKANAVPQLLLIPVRNARYTISALAATIAWSPADPDLLLTSNGDVAYIWNVKQKKIIITLGANTDPTLPIIGALSWSPNGRYIAGSYTPVGGLNEGVTKMYHPALYIWDIDALRKTVKSSTTVQQSVQTFEENGSIHHTQAILDLQWSLDGRYLATSSLDTTVIIWKVDGG